MVETRKMLEHYELASKYKDLMFFCNWTLHPKLTRFNTIKPIIEEFEAITPEAVKSKSSFGPINDHLNGILSLDLLRDGLDQLYTEYNLPKHLVDDKVLWTAFTISIY